MVERYEQQRTLLFLPISLAAFVLLVMGVIGCNNGGEVRVDIDEPAGVIEIDATPRSISQVEKTTLRVVFQPEEGPITIEDYRVEVIYDPVLLPVLQEVAVSDEESQVRDFVLEFDGSRNDARLVLRLMRDVENLEESLSAVFPFVVASGGQLDRDEEREVRFNVVVTMNGSQVADADSPVVTLLWEEWEEPEGEGEEEE